MSILREYIRQVVKESQGGTSNLAALVAQTDSGATATLYDTHALEKRLPDLKALVRAWDRLPAVHLLRDEVVKGYIEVGEPDGRGPCRSAWEVKRSAGPGLGATVYGVGFALSPKGLLIPDRGYVSPGARAGWGKQASKRKRYPLDSTAYHNPDGSAAGLHPHHTDDPADDCATYDREDREHLDYAYEVRGDEGGILDALTAEHERTMSQVVPPDMTDAFDYLLDNAGQSFFLTHFDVNG